MTPSHDQLASPGEPARKTLAIRLEGEQHAQLTMIAQLEQLTVTDAIRQAIDGWIESKRNNPLLKQRAKEVLNAIEAEANTRRGAIAALLGDETSEPLGTESNGGRTSGRPSRAKGGEATTG
jgi:hypothetical protein